MKFTEEEFENHNGGIYNIDLTKIVYKLLSKNEDLLRVNKDSIFRDDIPESNLESPPLIRICFIDQTPLTYADDIQLNWDCTVQIDVWCDEDAINIANKINFLMKQINFKQSSPIIDFDSDTAIMRDGRRYTGVIEANKEMIIKQTLNK